MRAAAKKRRLEQEELSKDEKKKAKGKGKGKGRKGKGQKAKAEAEAEDEDRKYKDNQSEEDAESEGLEEKKPQNTSRGRGRGRGRGGRGQTKDVSEKKRSSSSATDTQPKAEKIDKSETNGEKKRNKELPKSSVEAGFFRFLIESLAIDANYDINKHSLIVRTWNLISIKPFTDDSHTPQVKNLKLLKSVCANCEIMREAMPTLPLAAKWIPWFGLWMLQTQ